MINPQNPSCTYTRGHSLVLSFFLSFFLLVLSIYHIFIYIYAPIHTYTRASLCHNVISFLFFTFYNRTQHIPDGARERDCSRFRESQRAADYRRLPRVFLSFFFLFFLFFNRQEKKNNPIESTYAWFAKHVAKLQSYIKLLREHRERKQ